MIMLELFNMDDGQYTYAHELIPLTSPVFVSHYSSREHGSGPEG